MTPDQAPKPARRHLERPSKEQIKLLPPFDALPRQHIHVLRTPEDFAFALAQLRNEPFIGFDTESKPCFTSDAPRTGPHVLQFATREQAFIVQLNNDPPLDFLREVIESPHMVKVGFGLKSDRGPLQRKLGLQLGASIDLATGMRKLGYKQAVGYAPQWPSPWGGGCTKRNRRPPPTGRPSACPRARCSTPGKMPSPPWRCSMRWAWAIVHAVSGSPRQSPGESALRVGCHQ